MTVYMVTTKEVVSRVYYIDADDPDQAIQKIHKADFDLTPYHDHDEEEFEYMLSPDSSGWSAIESPGDLDEYIDL